jgi:hypothetical protein
MFIFFAYNKLSSDKKGQLIPIFIVILVILIIMAMITVNLSKVGLVKTDSSNAADAGALAGGSVMAGVFNTQAIANSQLMVNYQMFIAEMATLTGVIIIAALWASIGCYSVPCTPFTVGSTAPLCLPGAGVAVKGTIAAMVSVTAFHIAQVFTYMNMRKQAEKGRKQAIEMAYRYAFLNSGIGNKLIPGSPPTGPADKRGNDNNYSETLNAFIKSGAVTSGDYAWKDGQDRQHQVNVNVITEDVDSYKLKYTVLPTLAVLYLINEAWVSADILLTISCPPCPCSATAAISATEIAIAMGLALAGLIPAWTMDASTVTNILFPICWVVDINHDRRLSVTTWQEHGKQDYGLWQATYPHIESRSKVNFNAGGGGKIYSPSPKFDTDIIETD